MELPRRKPNDVYLADGAMREAMESLRTNTAAHELRIGIVYAFDFRTRMLPYWYADTRMAPCAVRTLGDVLDSAGFKHVRIVLQQWTPNFKPSKAQLDDKPLDILMVSAMQVHAEPAYDLIRDAHKMGESRPLILAGGPKMIYEPTDLFELGPEPGVSADCVVTGEAYVMLHLLKTLIEHRTGSESTRETFTRLTKSDALTEVPGLVYLSPDAPASRPVAVNTGVQRLLRNLDELPLPDAGYRMLESPHRGTGMRPKPIAVNKLKWRTPIASVISTQGCKFNCSYCPIPAVNQRTWRHKSPQRLADEIKHIYENFGISYFFGTDDNFFNNRETVIELMTALSEATTNGEPLRKHIRFYTEATQFDVHKNRDILPLCRKAGMRGIWFGIEDITADLVNKGQNAVKTADMFTMLTKIGIMPMAMMIHSDDQPLYSKREDLTGVINQAKYLFETGAVSYQCTYLGPAVGTREFENAADSNIMFKRVGNTNVPQAYQDGNHIVSSRHARPWERQFNLMRAYASFYNPVNTIRTLLRVKRDSVSYKRLIYQFLGQIGLVYTLPKMLTWAWKLRRGPIEKFHGLEPAKIPMVDATSRREINWAIKHPPQPNGASTTRTVPDHTPELVQTHVA